MVVPRPSSWPAAVPQDLQDVARAQEGGVEAFARVVGADQEALFRLAFDILRDRGAAEEVVQDTFVVVWRSLPSLEDLAAYPGWVRRIALRRALGEARARRRRAADLVLDLDVVAGDDGLLAGPGDCPDAAFEHADRQRVLSALLLGLPEPLRVCWKLRELDGLSYLAIAEGTGVSVSTVRGRIARARHRLAAAAAVDDAWRCAG